MRGSCRPTKRRSGTLLLPGAQATGARRSFFEGLLAVVLATPCSAPFLGTAIGFAFASPAPTIVAIFLAIGVGLAAPFVLVTLAPGLARFVPKSGPWMLHLRSALGFARSQWPSTSPSTYSIAT